MKIQQLSALTGLQKQRILNRSSGSFLDILPRVEEIIQTVKKDADAALLTYTERFDGVALDSLAVSRAEVKNAYTQVDAAFTDAVTQVIANLTAVAQQQRKTDTPVTPVAGVTVSRVWRPIERVGLYVPGGKANYPSTVLMTTVTATVSGCTQLVITTPPRKDGTISPYVLVAADMAGVSEIYKVGGAQAVAALAYGTKTIRSVSKIFGPGNAYVTAAKQLVMNDVAIDMPAGPSEVFIIADETSNPAFIAADLLADGEHGDDSACVLVTTSKRIATETIKELEKQLSQLPALRADYARASFERYGLISVCTNLDEAIAFSNEYAPEHLQIMTANPHQVVERITNAGSVFVGNYTSKSSGDYATGANHVLPTGSMAKAYPPLGVDAFGRWMQVQECSEEGLAAIRNAVELFAEVEELPAHKRSTSIRFDK